MYALSVHQPYASLLAVGVKTIEWRSWPWKYTGPLVICATKKNRIETDIADQYLPTGAAVAITDMTGCREFTKYDLIPACIIGPDEDPDEYEHEHGPVTGYAWLQANHREVEPVPVKGKQGPWIWPGPDLVLSPGYHERIGF